MLRSLGAAIAKGRGSSGWPIFIKDNFSLRFIGHCGSQNGFTFQFFHQPERKAAQVVTFNTTATSAIPGDRGDKRNTRTLNHLLKKDLFKNAFSIIPAKP